MAAARRATLSRRLKSPSETTSVTSSEVVKRLPVARTGRPHEWYLVLAKAFEDITFGLMPRLDELVIFLGRFDNVIAISQTLSTSKVGSPVGIQAAHGIDSTLLQHDHFRPRTHVAIGEQDIPWEEDSP